ncbi:hypothetical protein [Lactobacillus delbrueckii]|uniref:hypothetical protein n=1 Tax=Lactobacillus delbrueckii TaxID=1584 RepID=UPI00138AB64E|nr:hypothetical protein [Lactobacillus delbrueckii]
MFKAGQPVAAASEKLSTKVIDGKKNYGIYSSLKQVRSRLAGQEEKDQAGLEVWQEAGHYERIQVGPCPVPILQTRPGQTVLLCLS